MPLRNRLRRAFTRGSHDDPAKPKPDPNVYQPGEKMPPLKYKRIPAPEHTAHLESFTWAKAWRRRSNHSVYSPMGSRMVSRKSSFASFGSRSGSRSRRSRSLHRKSMSRVRDGIDSGVGGSFAGDVPEQVIEDSDDEGDVLNVGLSRNPTQDPRREQREQREAQQREAQQRERASSITSTSRPPTSTAIRNDTPFNAADLELALKRSHLAVPQEESPGHSGDASPQSPGLRPREAIAV